MATLGPAVSSLSSSLSLLSSSISILDSGVSDFPRLTRVLSTQKHFELLPEHQLREAQQSLVDEIAPAISQLLNIAENYVNQLARKEESLKARSELLKGRLEVSQARKGSSGGAGSFGVDGNIGGGGMPSGKAMDPAKALEVKQLQQKKERLVYAIQRLELESKQKERELRKSMAFVRD
jgi:DASH complex subunit SPC19